MVILLVLLAVQTCTSSLTCPRAAADSTHVRLRSARPDGEPPSELTCPAALFSWNREKLGKEISDIFTIEQKKFIRFRAPVHNYTNAQLGLEQWSGRLTWVWVAGKFDYLLFYPQNYQTLSFGTTDVVAENTKEEEIYINCTACDSGTSCGVGFYELKEAVQAEASVQGIDWEYLCVEADNRVLDIVQDYPPEQELAMLNTRNFAVPDILYQFRFLKFFFSSCSFFTLACKNVTNYFCYSQHNGNCVVKELLSHYPKIIYLSLLFCLFFPILVFYLPSSRPVYSVKQIKDLFPTYKLPVYLGRLIQSCLCYQTLLSDSNGAFFIRLRRAFGFVLLSFFSFRFLVLPAYQPLSWVIWALFFSAALWPDHLSVYITPNFPRSFPLFTHPYPEGLVRLRGSRNNSIEYQRLANIMVERIYLPFDYNFWVYVCENSFREFNLCFSQQMSVSLPLWVCKVALSAVVGAITLSLSVVIVLTYFIVPLPYFAKELFLAINSGVYTYCHTTWTSQSSSIIAKVFRIFLSFVHGSVLCILLLYLILTLFSLSFLLTEVTIFTYLGASIAANTVFHYFVLIVAFGSTVYAIVHSIHKQYYNVVRDTELIFENDADVTYIKTLMSKQQRMKLDVSRALAMVCIYWGSYRLITQSSSM